MSCSSKYEKLVEYIKTQREVYANIIGFVDSLESEETVSNFTMPDSIKIDIPDSSVVDFTNGGYGYKQSVDASFHTHPFVVFQRSGSDTTGAGARAQAILGGENAVGNGGAVYRIKRIEYNTSIRS